MGDKTAIRALGYPLRSILGTDDGWRFIQLGFG